MLLFEEIDKEPFFPPLLNRLPAAWTLPQPVSVTVPVVTKTATASSSDSAAVFSGWENPIHRHVGTLVHLQLERLARHGIDKWLNEDRGGLQQRLKYSLSRYGVASADLDGGVERVIAMINTTVTSHRGRWILENHPEAQCELPLTGVVDGKLIHAVIDRTFVAEGYRWVIDYKTSAPARGEAEVEFMNREAEHYREQLNTYTQLLNLQSDCLPIKAALYFPVIDGWYEN